MTAARRRFWLSCLLPFAIASVVGILLLGSRRTALVTLSTIPCGPPMPAGPIQPALAAYWDCRALLDPRGHLWMWGGTLGMGMPTPNQELPWPATPVAPDPRLPPPETPEP